MDQAGFEALLREFREGQTEGSTTDGKEILHFGEEGDKAYFIRHTAALANNVRPSYMIVGVKDGTWEPVGLPQELCDCNFVQNRMNQILNGRLDPSLSVRYCKYKVSGDWYGLVIVEGKRAPYIIAIEDQTYGGDRTRARPEYIYRGAIYVRQGDSSVIANSQSDILRIIDEVTPKPDKFLTDHKYLLDVDSEQFGHHKLTESLVEGKYQKGWPQVRYVDIEAKSWVTFVFRPVGDPCEIDTIQLKEKLKSAQMTRRGDEWYRDIPEWFRGMLLRSRAYPQELLVKYYPLEDTDFFTQFVRVKSDGYIEVGGTSPLFLQNREVRQFHFVCLIGYLWQTICLVQDIYQKFGFRGRVGIQVNLIGTEGTRLVYCADGQLDLGSPNYRNVEHVWFSRKDGVCEKTNIKIEIPAFSLVGSLDEGIKKRVREVDRKLGACYSEEKPLSCFDRGTGEFPVKKYQDYCG